MSLWLSSSRTGFKPHAEVDWFETGYDVDCSKVHQCERVNTHSIRIETG